MVGSQIRKPSCTATCRACQERPSIDHLVHRPACVVIYRTDCRSEAGPLLPSLLMSGEKMPVDERWRLSETRNGSGADSLRRKEHVR